ncbi:MAG: polyprenyl diphosphate synthase [Candidatus Paceibacterota bacterium]
MKTTQDMKIPQHVAIIMDGNRRWARQQGLSASFGHKQMVEKGVETVVRGAKNLGIKYLTLWAFSTENWKRDRDEVQFLMKLFRQLFSKEAKKLHEEGVRIRTIGDLTRFDQDIQGSVAEWVKKTAKNSTINVTFALNYGGQDEILRAVEKIAQEVKQGNRQTQKMKSAEFEQYLDTVDLPRPDMIIRPGGEQRLSGFLAWQSAYAELYFTDVLMPDFDEKELAKAVEEFGRRQRRFGK